MTGVEAVIDSFGTGCVSVVASWVEEETFRLCGALLLTGALMV